MKQYGGGGALKSKKLLILAIVVILGLFMMLCLNSESKAEYYAKRVPPDSSLLYVNLDKISSTTTLEDVQYPFIGDIFIGGMDICGAGYYANMLGAKEMVIVSHFAYGSSGSNYIICSGNLDTNYINDMIVAKARENNIPISSSYSYDGFKVYEVTPSISTSIFVAFNKNYFVRGYPCYLAKYALDLLSGKEVDHSLYTQYKGLISRLPSGASVYYISPSDFGYGSEEAGLALFSNKGTFNKVFIVLQCFNEDSAKDVLNHIKNEYKYNSDEYSNFRIVRDGKFVVLEYSMQH